jgi:hypothetical protein
MAHIGNFTRTEDGYCGRLRTLTIDVELTLVPANVRIPTQGGQVFQSDRGQPTDLMAATIPI